MSKGIVTFGAKPEELSREHEYLTAMFNDLHAQGLQPVLTQVLTQGDADEQPGTEHRMVVVCVPQ